MANLSLINNDSVYRMAKKRATIKNHHLLKTASEARFLIKL